MEKNRTEFLQSIVQHLILHSSFLKNLGLLNGKMGIAIFFFHLARYRENNIYSDFGGELIDEIYNEINVGSPLDFKDGLSGIAWGIEYLIRNNFVDADPEEILEDIDKRIQEWDVRRIQNTSLESGLIGLAYYAIIRCANRKRQAISDEYIMDLIYSLSKEDHKVIHELKMILEGQKLLGINNPLFSILPKNSYDINSLLHKNSSLGVGDNGLAGIGLNIIKAYEKEDIYI